MLVYWRVNIVNGLVVDNHPTTLCNFKADVTKKDALLKRNTYIHIRDHTGVS